MCKTKWVEGTMRKLQVRERGRFKLGHFCVCVCVCVFFVITPCCAFNLHEKEFPYWQRFKIKSKSGSVFPTWKFLWIFKLHLTPWEWERKENRDSLSNMYQQSFRNYVAFQQLSHPSNHVSIYTSSERSKFLRTFKWHLEEN